MREEIANLVFPIFTFGIQLQQRLAAKEDVDFATSQRELQGRLQSSSRARRWDDYGGDAPVSGNSSSGADPVRTRAGHHFLGIRYAMVCWLDEIFIRDSPWREQWRNQCLELGLRYDGVERAWRFWEQAELASARPNTDALEVFYLCAMLGFRGNKSPEELKTWCDRAKVQLAQGQTAVFRPPVEGPFETDVRELKGVDWFKRLVTPVFILTILIVCLGSFLVVQWFIS